MTRPRGALALVLHSHMPYVEGFGTWPFGEEWLWEAVASAYLPLLDVVDGAHVTIGLTPVLCDQLEAMRGPAGERYLAFLRDVRAAIHAEDADGLERGGEPILAAEVRRAAGDYVAADAGFERHGRDLIGAFRALEGVELWTSSATHALLPLLATDAGRRLQLGTGTASHRRRFGAWHRGFWLPECGYLPGVERALADHGVRVFCVDQTGRDGFDHLRPVATEAGPVAVPIDWSTVELVWNDRAGYPSHGTYRDYHRRTLHDLKPWNNRGGAYDRSAAEALAREHARDFSRRAGQRLERGGLLCCALDTELLGHWWYEGPLWLAALLEEAPRAGLSLVTVTEGLELVTPAAGTALAASSWGTDKDLSTWDAPGVSEFAFGARDGELRTVRAAALATEPRAALVRAARELLALQASDWAFMAARALAGDYPHRRLATHSRALDAALAALTDSAGARPGRAGAEEIPQPELRNLAPDLDVASLTTP